MFPQPLSDADRKRLVACTRIVADKFSAGDWRILGGETSTTDLINGHGRLLRSLSWNDEDYKGNAYTVMQQIVGRDHANLDRIEQVIRELHGDTDGLGESISTAPSKSRTITFAPNVFDTPDGGVQSDLIAVMMPFTAEFEDVYQAISGAAFISGFQSKRAKDIWQHTAIIQDVFSLIFRARIVVCDFTGKNPNVFYEAGIAHTLGKHVVPITQSAADVPFDLNHHRYQHYHNNREGRTALTDALAKRFQSLR